MYVISDYQSRYGQGMILACATSGTIKNVPDAFEGRIRTIVTDVAEIYIVHETKLHTPT